MTYRWYVPLAGSSTDIEDLRQDLRTGDLRIEDREGVPCLYGAHLDACHDDETAYRKAKELVVSLNDAFMAAVEHYESVRVDGAIWQVQPDGKLLRRQRIELATLRVKARLFGNLTPSRPILAPEPTLVERMLIAAEKEEYFRVALRLFAIRPMTFPALFVAFETIKQAGEDGNGRAQKVRKRGGERIVAKNWATEDEMRDFFETAQLHRHGQPPDPIKEGHKEMTLKEGRNLMRRLLTRWAQELVP